MPIYRMPSVAVIVLLGAASFAQSPFDGTWLNKAGEQLPKGPSSYSLNAEIFRCSCAIGDIEVSPTGTTMRLPKRLIGTRSMFRRWMRMP